MLNRLVAAYVLKYLSNFQISVLNFDAEIKPVFICIT